MLANFLIIIITQITFSADLPYLDREFNCFSQEVANRYISDFNINVNSFGGLDLCNADNETKKLLNDLYILENGQFRGASNNKFIRGFVAADGYYRWLKNETRGVRRGHDIPYATAYNSGGYFTMQDGWAKLSTLGRVGTFVHEARHTAGYRHIRCNQGPYQDTSVSGCDSTYNYGGSHAVEMEYYARVALDGVNFHPVYKKMARLMAIARSNVFFNAPVIQSREAVLAVTQDGREAHLYDQGQWHIREVPQAEGRLKRTSYGGVLFDGLKAFSIELYENSGFADFVADTYSYYKLLAESQTAVRDFEEFDVGTKRYAVRVSNNNKLAQYNFAQGAWGREISLPTEVVTLHTAVPGRAENGLYLVNAIGEIYNYQPQTQKITKEEQKWPVEFQEVIAFKGHNLILMKEGSIYVLNDGQMERWQTPGIYSGLISTPVYDGFEVVKE